MQQASIFIPPELFAPAESSHFEGVLELDSLEMGPDTYTFADPLLWQVDVTNTDDAFLVMGTVECDARTECARCLEDAEFHLIGEIEGYYLIEEEQKPEDMEGDEFDLLPENNVIDLVPLITAALLVEVPLVPLCDDDCRGLCATCGKNLNEGACDCGAEVQEDELEGSGRPNPFAVLKDFKFEE